MENRFAWLTQGNKGIIAGNQNLTIQIPTIKNYRIWSVQLKFQPLVEEGDRNTLKKRQRKPINTVQAYTPFIYHLYFKNVINSLQPLLFPPTKYIKL